MICVGFFGSLDVTVSVFVVGPVRDVTSIVTVIVALSPGPSALRSIGAAVQPQLGLTAVIFNVSSPMFLTWMSAFSFEGVTTPQSWVLPPTISIVP
jgi:hypothetical protein